MTSITWLRPPALFVFLSLAAGVLNFLDTLARLAFFYMLGEPYFLSLTLKPIFLGFQVVCLILFLVTCFRSKSFAQYRELNRLLAIQLVLAVITALLFSDLLVISVLGMATDAMRGFLELALYVTYFLALSGTTFYIAFSLFRSSSWKTGSIVFVLIGLVYSMVFLEHMFFWSQNYLNTSFPSAVALASTYGPTALMFFAGLGSVLVLDRVYHWKNASTSRRALPFLLVPAFIFPIVWNNYKEGLVNLVFLAMFDWGFGFRGIDWYSVSMFLTMPIAYFLILGALSQRLSQGEIRTLILLGAASLPWNGVTVSFLGYSSIPGNMLSLNALIVGFFQLPSFSEAR